MRTALEHREPDRIPLDFGSTNVTGIHVSCVAALRDYYGLAPGPVKVYEPFQMLGWIDDDLHAAMGLDVTGVFPRKTNFGAPAADWKAWNFRGLEVLVPGDFRTTVSATGDILLYPQPCARQEGISGGSEEADRGTLGAGTGGKTSEEGCWANLNAAGSPVRGSE